LTEAGAARAVRAAGTAARKHDEMVAEREVQYRRTRGQQPDTWGAIASRFRADPKRELDPFLEKLASFLGPDDVLVDIGGGAGRNSLPMASQCREVINVEPSPGMLAEFRASAEEAGIGNARAVQSGWMEARGVEGDVLLAAHVTYFVPQIQPFFEKLQSACRRRVIIDVLTVPPPNQSPQFFHLVYGEDQALVPGPQELLAVLEEMGLTPDVIDVGGATARRPLPRTREDAISNELAFGWIAPHDLERARNLFIDHFDELWLETRSGFARRGAEDVRELMITWEPDTSRPPRR
jgi:SAM-dependent methyltransferase